MKASQLQIRVSHSQKEVIRKSALLAGVDMSEWVLSRLFPSKRVEFEKLLEDLAKSQTTINRSFSLAAINDFLSLLTSSELPQSLPLDLERFRLSPLMQNYVAAMIEMACHKQSVIAPSWLNDIQNLEEPFFGTNLLSLRLYLLTNSPPPFRRRNIFVDSSIGDRV